MALAAAAQITFSGNSRDVMEIEPEFSTGLKRIFVLNSAEGVSMTYTATTENPVTWSVYDEMGGAYATEVEGVEFNGLESTLHNVKADCGYIITEGTIDERILRVLQEKDKTQSALIEAVKADLKI